MKKVFFALAVLILVFAVSCNKTPAGGGSWTFLGNTYYVTSCVGSGSYISATNSSNTNSTIFGGLTIQFSGTALPKASGTYTVVDTVPIGTQVAITATVGGPADTAYAATGNGQTVAVTVSGGKVSVSGSNIELQNANINPASFPLSFNVNTN
jgi:hypothetical protein